MCGYSYKFCEVFHGSIAVESSSSELFRQPLIEMRNSKYPLAKLTDVIDWPTIEHSFAVMTQPNVPRSGRVVQTLDKGSRPE